MRNKLFLPMFLLGFVSQMSFGEDLTKHVTKRPETIYANNIDCGGLDRVTYNDEKHTFTMFINEVMHYRKQSLVTFNVTNMLRAKYGASFVKRDEDRHLGLHSPDDTLGQMHIHAQVNDEAYTKADMKTWLKGCYTQAGQDECQDQINDAVEEFGEFLEDRADQQ